MMTFKLVFGDNEPIVCDWRAQPGWHLILKEKLPPQVAVRDYWYNSGAAPIIVMTVCLNLYSKEGS